MSNYHHFENGGVGQAEVTMVDAVSVIPIITIELVVMNPIIAAQKQARGYKDSLTGYRDNLVFLYRLLRKLYARYSVACFVFQILISLS